MDRKAVRHAYDEQLRRNPPGSPDGTVERNDEVTRFWYDDGSWAGVIWSDLDEANADEVIAEQVRRFASVCEEWEWKHYSYDRPADLQDRLVAAGFARESDEAMLVADIADLDLDVAPPPGVELRPVVDEADGLALVRVHEEVFGDDHSAVGRHVMSGIAGDPPTVAAVVAWAGDTPICAARLEFNHGTDFAGLFGGGTLPDWRGRGVFRAVVAYRAALAAEHGFRYLQVDAMPDSRPILKRLGFVELATTVPFTYSASP
jgi:GNAT superfamily N-acetyltransferase